MRYKVDFVKLNGLTHNGSEDRDWETILLRGSEPNFQKCQNMIVLKNPDNLVQSKKDLNIMVNTEPDDFGENDQKESFPYPIPRVRASFTLKVAPDSAAADLPAPIIEPIESKNSSTQTLSSLTYDKTSLVDYGPRLPDNDLVPPVKHFKPSVPAQPILANSIPKPPKSIVANKSTHNIPNDDKDFEIPLEESLKAVEDFIKREKELSKWNIGEDVLAKWKGNGLYYKAKILDIFPSGIVVVFFDSYDIKEEIDYKDLCKFFKKTSEYKKKGQPKEKMKSETEYKNKTCAKKKIKVKRQTKRMKVVFKTSDMLRRKLLLKNSPLIKSKRRSQTNIKNKKKN